MGGKILQGEVIEVNYKSTVNDNKNNIKVRIYPYDNNPSDVIVATPLYPNTSINPIEGEIVLLLQSLNSYSSYHRKFYNYYYFAKVNIHNNVNNNILKGASNTKIVSDNKTKLNSIQNSINGAGLSGIDFSVEFDEKFTPSVQQYPGDESKMGRFGNHIRLTRSKPENKEYNKNIQSWKPGNKNNDPILTIVNGYGSSDDVITEDINKDDTSFYMTSTQKISLDLTNKKFDSFNENIKIEDYKKPQFILNSGRIILNSKEDGIIFSSKKYINLSTDEIHLNANSKYVLDSPETYIGSKNADEPLVLGDENEKRLKELMGVISDIINTLQTHTHATPVGPTPPPIIEIPKTRKHLTDLNTVKSKLNKIKSKIAWIQKNHS